MKKKKIIILIIIFVLIFLGYKVYLLNKYSVDKRDIDTNSIFSDDYDSISIASKEYKGSLFTYKNISFKNDFKDYTKNEHNWYIERDKDNNVTSAIYLTKMDQFHNLLTDGNLEIINDEEKDKKIVNKFFTEEDKNAFLKENNIKNDIDLLYYIKNNYYLKSNVLTCSKKIKQNYIINSFVEISLPSFSKILLITGDLNGYILYSNENIRQVHILNNNEQFIISLVGEKLVSDEYIFNLLETIKIN